MTVKVADFFECPITDGDVGLEIELEGLLLPNIGDQHWKTEADGSLKGGKDSAEYVMKKPVPIYELENTLKKFNEYFKNSEVDNSFYAGTHVHVNVQNISTVQLINFICACLTVEDILCDWCGHTRKGNHFCLRSSDAEYIIEYIKDILLTENLVNVRGNDDIRYCFFNLKSLGKYGSLEFRSLDSTINVNRLTTWSKILVKLRDISIRFKSPVDLIKHVSLNKEMWLQEVFGENYYQFVDLNSLNSLEEGLERAEEIAFCRDWNVLNLNIFVNQKTCF